jgi:hypothetical protein
MLSLITENSTRALKLSVDQKACSTTPKLLFGLPVASDITLTDESMRKALFSSLPPCRYVTVERIHGPLAVINIASPDGLCLVATSLSAKLFEMFIGSGTSTSASSCLPLGLQ